MIERGAVYWADLGEVGEGNHRPAKMRPVVVVQADSYNESRLATVIVVALTSNPSAARFPDNVVIPAAESGLPKDSVANLTQIATINRYELPEPATGRLSPVTTRRINQGLSQVLGLTLL